jgi:hypothetical protein
LPWFEDVTAASGIHFQHFDSVTPINYIVETFGSGLAWIDYDNDGWPDLFCVQDGPLPPPASKGLMPVGSSLPTSKLYHNNRDGTFTDVTKEVGLDRAGYGMGCAVGDFDNDGYDDLVVTYFGGVVLYHNEPDGKGGRRFVDVTAKSGLHDPHWATSCAWGDIDGDGLLDLYICNYVEIDFKNYPTCLTGPIRYQCPPSLFTNVGHKLYRNNGDGTFTDISVSSGITAPSPAPGLAVIMADLDGDGLLDIYVANDARPAYLFHNQGKGKFVEKALLNGCGLGPHGQELAGMGVDAGDIDGSGRLSLFVTNFQDRPKVLFRNRGDLIFQEWSGPSGLAKAGMDRLAFGCIFFDADLDGRLDIAMANGHVDRTVPELSHLLFAQEAQLFLGDGRGHFRDVSHQAGSYFHERLVGRGLACADYNNDGKPDLAFSHNGGPAVLLQNRTDTKNGWICLELIGDSKGAFGKKSNRNAIGARVEIESGGVKQVRIIRGGGSYLSESERRLLFGLGDREEVDKVTVRWPSERRQVFEHLQGRRWWRLHEGQMQAEKVER